MGQIWESDLGDQYQVYHISIEHPNRIALKHTARKGGVPTDGTIYDYGLESLNGSAWSLIKDVDICVFCKKSIKDDYICEECLELI